MADCHYCGAPIRWATRVDTGERVALDRNISRFLGPGRFRLSGVDPDLVVPVDDDQPVNAHSGHEETCAARLLKESR